MGPMNPIEGLPLAAPTPPGWAEAAVRDLDALLADHAHCELKAASMALSIVAKFGDDSGLVRDMTALAHEELRHFERVHAKLRARGGSLGRVRPDRYVKRLRERGTSSLADLLVVSAFVEARSCERFRLLSGAPVDKPLRDFWAELASAESRHHELFLDRAQAAAGAAEAARIVRDLARFEAKLIAELPFEPRIH